MKEAEAFGQGRIGDLDGLIRELDGWTGTLNQALAELADSSLEGTDPGEIVRARVSGAGRLQSLTIDTRKYRDLDHLALSQAVQEAITAAKLAIGDRLTELTAGLALATDDPGADPLAPYVDNVLRGE
ncbi:YbaB/EbfC family nucleoid-associated protein [Nonomuraea typhae]|uniref:YbaB/EbfC family nucleoid-associated protein n=1 Tax=Nonomuraea typhae TaxID=2603600 RepID=UPI0012FC2022|nr:YbaB/EbfC family nucleoid-associated protein [Nonomuraea typhae]